MWPFSFGLGVLIFSYLEKLIRQTTRKSKKNIMCHRAEWSTWVEWCRQHASSWWKRCKTVWDGVTGKVRTLIRSVLNSNESAVNAASFATQPVPESPTIVVQQPTSHPPVHTSQPLSSTQHRTLAKARKRAQQRWCRWLTAKNSRIGRTNGLRKRLGEKHWRAFVKHATEHFRPQFVAKFSAPMSCCGPLGAHMPCPNG